MINKVAQQGFTIIETLVAVTILVLAISGPNLLANRGLQSALVAKDKLAAYQFAQDAVEFMRYARDTNRLRGGDWITGQGASPAGIDLSNCLASVNASGCVVDSFAGGTDQNPTTCTSGACTSVQYLIDAGSGGLVSSPSNFTRTVVLTPVTGSPYEMNMKVTVSWTLYGITRSIFVSENLFKWQ